LAGLMFIIYLLGLLQNYIQLREVHGFQSQISYLIPNYAEWELCTHNSQEIMAYSFENVFFVDKSTDFYLPYWQHIEYHILISFSEYVSRKGVLGFLFLRNTDEKDLCPN
jgi:hypothetical protein